MYGRTFDFQLAPLPVKTPVFVGRGKGANRSGWALDWEERKREKLYSKTSFGPKCLEEFFLAPVNQRNDSRRTT